MTKRKALSPIGDTPTLGLALIARDEEDTLPNLLASIEGAFDQVVLLDTGSKDRTVDVFTEWAGRQQLPLGFKVDHFEWIDDFAAAYNAADALLDTDWVCQAECDEEILCAGDLRSTLDRVPPNIHALYFPRDVGDPRGCQPRCRATRRGAVRWVGRVHELPFVDGMVGNVPGPTTWLHRKQGGELSDWPRNLEIAHKWVAEEPDNPLAQQVLAKEHLLLSHSEPEYLPSAMAGFRRYLDMEPVREELDTQERDRALWAIEAFERGFDSEWAQLYMLLLQAVQGRPPDFWVRRCAEEEATAA
jgi:hypothetical protein